MKKKTPETTEQKQVRFRRLVYESLPEMWSFQFLAGIVLAVPAAVLTGLINRTAATAGAITTANMKALLLSWRLPVILVLGFFLVMLYVMIELFSLIHLTDDILKGERTGLRREIPAAFRSLRRFMTPAGLLVLLYIFLAVPLCGIGFSIGLTESFYIPNFIMDVVWKSPLYAVGYVAVIVFLIWLGYRSVFTLHAVLIDGMTPAEGRRRSVQIIKANGKRFFFGLVRIILILFLIVAAVYVVFVFLPGSRLERVGKQLPSSCVIDVFRGTDLTETEKTVLGYRILSALTVLMGTYLVSIAALLAGSYLMLRFTRWYLEYTGRGQDTWPERPRKARYRTKVFSSIAVFVMVALFAVLVGLFYNLLFDREEPVRIIAHRAGGTMASENSLEGLQLAIDHGCYASEIDVQRTADGYYIINHDNDFKRLTGVAKAPQDMTLDEIRELRIRDTTGSGGLLPVVTLEEMLEVIKGKELLFIELKGATADRQMADDVVRIVREHDCVDDVALISLNYDVIDYAETAYPEFLTGTLFFAGIGNVSNLNCDLLIMEEETATTARIGQIHAAGKDAIVWTVNTEVSLALFLDSEADAVITDEILLAEQVQAELDARTDLEVLRDKLGSIWQ